MSHQSQNMASADVTCNMNSSDIAGLRLQQQIQSADEQSFMDFSQPLVEKERVMIICRVENDGEIKENKPIYIPRLHWQKDLKLSVLGPIDIKVLHNSIHQGVNMIAVSCVESKDDITYVKKILGSKGQQIMVLAKLQS